MSTLKACTVIENSDKLKKNELFSTVHFLTVLSNLRIYGWNA